MKTEPTNSGKHPTFTTPADRSIMHMTQIEKRRQLIPMLNQIMSTENGRDDLAAFLSEVVDELHKLGEQAKSRAERDACKCCICSETETKGRPVTEQERKQLWAAMRGAVED